MLQFRNISVAYGDGEPSLTDFTLDVAEGEIVALVGESGSGKTTAIRTAIGLLPGDGEVVNGDILFNGNSLLTLSPNEWRALRGRQISMIFQDSGAMLNPIRRIGSQFVEYICTHRSVQKKEAWEMGRVMLEHMGLPHSETIMNSYIFQLSGGMRQRVGIAMAMVFQPQLLLADEPTSALDVTTQSQIIRQMLELREKYGAAILLVTHNLGVAAYMADRIIVMKDGCIVDQGTREELLHQPAAAYTRDLLDAVPSMRGKRYV
ncbi:peptide ABC transporter ATP-binding protein [Acetonema longum DSM 6540]|uniref:Peptide ABC transporter ATP-binding protein n=2 Tax=Acetonema TaxID=2373 RepID=F7NJB9_9FIRM|nr:peptide ABC transporter ATP-binding protein [Acetonema longum DSM 6540]